ncbi:MAG: Mur ligase domain-containing protein, partial [Acidimicrobiales bacterium]
MRVGDLLREIEIEIAETRGNPGMLDVDAIELDSRRVRSGSLFCCVPGRMTDGHLHAADAVGCGAIALLCERFLPLAVPQVRVHEDRIRPAMAQMAAAFFGHPSR